MPARRDGPKSRRSSTKDPRTTNHEQSKETTLHNTRDIATLGLNCWPFCAINIMVNNGDVLHASLSNKLHAEIVDWCRAAA
jgi:hypothetical protein